MSKETISPTECRFCVKIDVCPIPSDKPDMRLCFTPIKQGVLWKEED